MKKYALLTVFILVFTVSGAAAVNSCDSLTYDSESDLLSGKVWKCEVTENRISQEKISITLDSTDFPEPIKDSTSTAVIETSNLRNVMNYRFDLKQTQNSLGLPRSIYTFDIRQFWIYDWEDFDKKLSNNCVDFDWDGKIERVEDPALGRTYITCADIRQKEGDAANIIKEQLDVRVDFTASINDKSTTKTLTNDNTGEGTTTRFSTLLGGDFAAIRWQGNLRSGVTIPDPNDYNVFGVHSNDYESGWVVGRESRYTDYRTYLQNGFKTLLQDVADGADIAEAETNVNEQAQDAVSPYTGSGPFDMSGDLTSITSSDINDGTMQINLQNIVSFPVFDVFLDGSGSLKVVTPDPDLANPSGTGATFGEGESGVVKASVENVGSGDAGVTATISCGEGFSAATSSQFLSVPAGERKTAEFVVSASSTSATEKEFSSTCTVTFEEGTTGETVSTQVQVTAVQLEDCQPGNRISGLDNGQQVIRECTSDGLRYKIVERCDEDETAGVKNGKLQCVKEKPPGRQGLLGKIRGEVNAAVNAVGDLFGSAGQGLRFLSAVAALFAGLVVFRIVANMISGVVPDPRAVLAVAAVVGGLTALGVFQIVSEPLVQLLIIAAAIIYVYLQGSIQTVVQAASPV